FGAGDDRIRSKVRADQLAGARSRRGTGGRGLLDRGAAIVDGARTGQRGLSEAYILGNLDPGEEHVTGLDILEEGIVVVVGIGGREGQRVVGYRGAPFARARDSGEAVLGELAIEPEAAIVRIGGSAATAAERNHRADNARSTEGNGG